VFQPLNTEIMKSNPIALLLAASWAQLQRASAEISLTVNIDDLDPLKECKRRENQCTLPTTR
jgi:hypothetical protein